MNKKIVNFFYTCGFFIIIACATLFAVSCGDNGPSITKYNNLKIGDEYTINNRDEANWLLKNYLKSNLSDCYTQTTISTTPSTNLIYTALSPIVPNPPLLKRATTVWFEIIHALAAYNADTNHAPIAFNFHYTVAITDAEWTGYVWNSYSQTAGADGAGAILTNNLLISGISGQLQSFYTHDQSGTIFFNIATIREPSLYYHGVKAI